MPSLHVLRRSRTPDIRFSSRSAAVYCPQTHEVYLVPVSDVPESSVNLRIDAPMNNREKGIRWAKSCVIPASTR